MRLRDYHELATVHHDAKADVYAAAGFGAKAAGHRHRARWHASFGRDELEELDLPAYDDQFDPVPHARTLRTSPAEDVLEQPDMHGLRDLIADAAALMPQGPDRSRWRHAKYPTPRRGARR
jgi:hypothetical protein